ncbi:hypothetical protein PAAG_11501 [Paracoccidioides lutzii Pb01]|uniref:Uncharacterized protein n=1 Tax=Paracoccidioides lutzii (strain ATCC MYA-826 / Pb01) TaxID=502779 RepID=A0A0A2V2S4_PARBA|nr:hypothetical protein PAAG_11501 [Paracoccidioides lutzii Pb01]KGQ01778.1 hypothetical protein PAAG_11501 [Paracoccidioides lutzii Pb01]
MPNDVITELAIEDLRGQKLLRIILLLPKYIQLAKKPYVSSIDMFKSHIMKLPLTRVEAHELTEELAGHDFASPSQITQNLIKRSLKNL